MWRVQSHHREKTRNETSSWQRQILTKKNPAQLPPVRDTKCEVHKGHLIVAPVTQCVVLTGRCNREAKRIVIEASSLMAKLRAGDI